MISRSSIKMAKGIECSINSALIRPAVLRAFAESYFVLVQKRIVSMKCANLLGYRRIILIGQYQPFHFSETRLCEIKIVIERYDNMNLVSKRCQSLEPISKIPIGGNDTQKLRWRGEKRKAMPKHRRAFRALSASLFRVTLRAERFCPCSLLVLLDVALATPASNRRDRKQNRFRYRLWGFSRWVLSNLYP